MILVALIVVVIFFIVVMAVDGNRFVVREYHFCDARIRKEARLVLLSDLHNMEYGVGNRDLLAAIREAEPDFIVVAGDMLTATRGHSFEPAIELLTALAKEYPVYYGNGNHELRIGLYPEQYDGMAAAYEAALSQIPLKRLLNEQVYLPELNVAIYGLDLARPYYRRVGINVLPEDYLTKALGQPDPDRVNLLIAHNPEYFDDYGRWGADMVVAGHVHGGIMRLPGLGGVISPRLKLFPQYDGGVFNEGRSTMYLSRGLGTHTLPVRIFNPGELIVIELHSGVVW
jgi:predicted MPP superfamily phosphohydrolase